MSYKDGFHIPPGGNYYAKTTFVTGPQGLIHCSMIATAFADFRFCILYFYYLFYPLLFLKFFILLKLDLPFFVPYSERSYFFTVLGNERNRELLRQRLLIDIEGVLQTCKAEGIHTLVTGATGCGAFHHDPKLEAELWEECIAKLGDDSPLQNVVFSVLDGENSPNWLAFSSKFPPRT